MTGTASELVSLRVVASRLGPLRDHVVFVGGMIRSLLVTDPGAPVARPTDDIDVVAAIASQAEYYAFAEKLRSFGFREDQREGARFVPCSDSRGSRLQCKHALTTGRSAKS